MTSDFNCDVLIVEDERIQCEEMAAFLAAPVIRHGGYPALTAARNL